MGSNPELSRTVSFFFHLGYILCCLRCSKGNDIYVGLKRWMEGDFWTCGGSFGISQVFKFLEPSAIVESNHFCLMSDDTGSHSDFTEIALNLLSFFPCVCVCALHHSGKTIEEKAIKCCWAKTRPEIIHHHQVEQRIHDSWLQLQVNC